MGDRKMNTYTIKCYRGVDDLLPVYAFTGNSQGDHSATNSIEDYIASKGWMSYIWGDDIDKTDQQAIYKEATRRNVENQKYIDKLMSEGRYKEEYEISIKLIHNPIYDDKQVFNPPIESYRFIFLDFSKP